MVGDVGNPDDSADGVVVHTDLLQRNLSLLHSTQEVRRRPGLREPRHQPQPGSGGDVCGSGPTQTDGRRVTDVENVTNRLQIETKSVGEPDRLQQQSSSSELFALKSMQSAMSVCTSVCFHCRNGWLGSRLVSVLDSGAERPGFKSQPRRCRVTDLGRLFTPIVPLFTKQQNWQQPS